MGFWKKLKEGFKKVVRGFDKVFGAPTRWVRDKIIEPVIDKVSGILPGGVGKKVQEIKNKIKQADPFYNGFFNENTNNTTTKNNNPQSEQKPG